MRPQTGRRAALAAVLWCLATCCMAAAPVAHVFLVQNSGWMEPFYSDPDSPFKALVTELVVAVTQAHDVMVLASFNQSLPGAPSPAALLAVTVDQKSLRGQVERALSTVGMAKRPGSKVAADTDLKEAVSAAIHTALNGKAGLVWLFTNNKNSPNNDQATARRNREFYALIHEGPDIKKALAFPLHMPVHGAKYSASGLMVYVFAIGDEGARQLDAVLRSGAIGKVITEPPARLKPLDWDSVRLTPIKVADAPGVHFSMLTNGLLRADMAAGARAPAAQISWRLENAMYPYIITSANLAARCLLAGTDQPILLGSAKVNFLAPGDSVPLVSVMPLPAGRLPGKWSFEALAAAGSAYALPGRIEIRLSEQKLALSPAFKERMALLFPGDPLPDIFTPPARVQGSLAVLPFEVRVHFAAAPLVALIGGLLAIFALAGAALWALTRPRKVQVTVDGALFTLQTRMGALHPVYDHAGRQVAQVKRTLTGHRLIDVREGAHVCLGPR